MIQKSMQEAKVSEDNTRRELHVIGEQRIVLIWDLDLFYDMEKHRVRQKGRQRICRFPEEYTIEPVLEDPVSRGALI